MITPDSTTESEPLHTAFPVKIFAADRVEIKRMSQASGIRYGTLLRMSVRQGLPKLRRTFGKFLPKEKGVSK